MPRLPKLLFTAALAATAAPPGPWPQILSSIGLPESWQSRVIILPAGAVAPPGLAERVESGAYLILEGASPAAELYGFRARNQFERVASVEDVHRPSLSIVWEKPLEIARFEIPPTARVFAKDRWSGAPLAAGLQRGAGAVLWLATSPGERGYERFPYILHALAGLGLDPPFRSSRLWAFFDDSYRARVDLDYFAERWRAAGIAALHVSAWHFFEPAPERDRYLENLIAACHRRGILVYAWIELPHVSEKFWNDHPQWREKTALLQDAQLDWRKLMNLADPECFRAARDGITQLIGRFDWDGVNLAELYFESLEGIDNPSRFTPMNPDVRRRFRDAHGFDPIELFGKRRDAASRRTFLDFRARLAREIAEQWLDVLQTLRRSRPHLDLVLTHVDDRFDTRMKDAIGADASAVLPLLDRHPFTFLIEDPATVWNLGPQRYPEIARRYAALTPRTERLAIDINIVERYQNVYPTRRQTGTELFQLVHLAAAAFPRVALYFENSILPADVRLLSSAAAVVSRMESVGAKTMVDSPRGFGLPWSGPALVDGRPWPVFDDGVLWLPKGPHTIEPAETRAPFRIRGFTGDLAAAAIAREGVELTYESASRAFALLDRLPARLLLDGQPAPLAAAGPHTLVLPHGRHTITLIPDLGAK